MKLQAVNNYSNALPETYQAVANERESANRFRIIS